MATNTFTLPVAATSALPPPYGFDDVTATTFGNMVPYEPLVTVTSGVVRCLGINDYGGGSGIEIWWNSSADPPNNPITMLYEEMTEIRLEHSGGTLILDPRPTGEGGDLDAGSSYESSGETYMWFAGVGGIWTVADVAAEYTVGIDTTVAAPAPGTPDNIVNTGKRGNSRGGGVAIPQAEYTTTQTSNLQSDPTSKPGQGKGHAGGSVIIDLPAQAGTFDLTPWIEGYDFASGKWYPILEGANITGGGSNQRLRVGPEVATVSNASANDLLPYMWRVRVEHGDATAVTYSVAYHLQ